MIERVGQRQGLVSALDRDSRCRGDADQGTTVIHNTYAPTDGNFSTRPGGVPDGGHAGGV